MLWSPTSYTVGTNRSFQGSNDSDLITVIEAAVYIFRCRKIGPVESLMLMIAVVSNRIFKSKLIYLTL